MLKIILLAGFGFLFLSGPVAAPVLAQGAAAEEEEDEAEESVPAPAPAKKGAAKTPARPDNMKLRLAEISRVHKAQLAFGTSTIEEWKKFWTKLRDERGLFEFRLGKQRAGFVESLRSLDPKHHGQSLMDFETLQNNVMKSFEDNQASLIREFTADIENRVKEFGAAQEVERARMAQDSMQAWAEERAALKIELPEENGKGKKGKKDKKDKKEKDKS